jgi:hypothetical protein
MVNPEPVAASRESDTPLAGWQELAVSLLAGADLHELRRRSLIDLAGAS